jgi:N-acetylglucosamine-6-phosphate deacetylase
MRTLIKIKCLKKQNMVITALNYRTNKPINVTIKAGCIHDISECNTGESVTHYVAPGLIDFQVNGFKGIDLNQIGLNSSDIKRLTQILFEKGVTSYFPTIITNATETISVLLAEVVKACETYTDVNDAITGIHLEGPFLSKEDGPRGAHDKKFIQAPSWELFSKWQEVAKGKIKIITLSPEWSNCGDFIKKCVQSGVIVSIGHTAASPEQIENAIKAGARMSTHLGNASHAMLPRHVNYVYEQLASDQLWSTVIADGFHVPDALLKIFLKTKPNQTILISDATSYAGLPSGVYSGHIGGDVELNEKGKLFVKNNPDLLAGSAQSLLWGVNQLVVKNMLPLSDAWDIASVKPVEFLYQRKNKGLKIGNVADLVLFEKSNDTIKVLKTIKSGKIVFSK